MGSATSGSDHVLSLNILMDSCLLLVAASSWCQQRPMRLFAGEYGIFQRLKMAAMIELGSLAVLVGGAWGGKSKRQLCPAIIMGLLLLAFRQVSLLHPYASSWPILSRAKPQGLKSASASLEFWNTQLPAVLDNQKSMQPNRGQQGK